MPRTPSSIRIRPSSKNFTSELGGNKPNVSGHILRSFLAKSSDESISNDWSVQINLSLFECIIYNWFVEIYSSLFHIKLNVCSVRKLINRKSITDKIIVLFDNWIDFIAYRTLKKSLFHFHMTLCLTHHFTKVS